MIREQRYTIVIPNNRYVFARFMAIFILTMNIIGFWLTFFYDNEKVIVWAVLVMMAVAAIFIKKLQKLWGDPITTGYFWAFFGWTMNGKYWIAATVFVLAVLNFLIRKFFTIKFTKKEININSRPSRTIKWFELNNVVLKDGLLTIDFTNDKLIQELILVAEESDVENEADFNEFCQQQIAAHSLNVGTPA